MYFGHSCADLGTEALIARYKEVSSIEQVFRPAPERPQRLKSGPFERPQVTPTYLNRVLYYTAQRGPQAAEITAFQGQISGV